MNGSLHSGVKCPASSSPSGAEQLRMIRRIPCIAFRTMTGPRTPIATNVALLAGGQRVESLMRVQRQVPPGGLARSSSRRRRSRVRRERYSPEVRASSNMRRRVDRGDDERGCGGGARGFQSCEVREVLLHRCGFEIRWSPARRALLEGSSTPRRSTALRENRKSGKPLGRVGRFEGSHGGLDDHPYSVAAKRSLGTCSRNALLSCMVAGTGHVRVTAMNNRIPLCGSPAARKARRSMCEGGAVSALSR